MGRHGAVGSGQGEDSQNYDIHKSQESAASEAGQAPESDQDNGSSNSPSDDSK